MAPPAAPPTTTVVDTRLPCGLLTGADTEPRRTLPMRAADAWDDLFLLDSGTLRTDARATALLARCLGDDDGLLVRELTLGDREALLIQLRVVSVGPELAGVVTCPDVSCRAALEFRIRADDLLLPPYDDHVEPHQLEHDEGETVAFRLPRVGDLDDALAAAPDDPAEARRQLISRCLTTARAALPDAVLDAVADSMAALDPQAELQVELTCTECGLAFWFVFDTGAFLLEELDARAAELVADVHQLASVYHWSEADILAMGPARRAVYLDLLDRVAPTYDLDAFDLSPAGAAPA